MSSMMQRESKRVRKRGNTSGKAIDKRERHRRVELVAEGKKKKIPLVA